MIFSQIDKATSRPDRHSLAITFRRAVKRLAQNVTRRFSRGESQLADGAGTSCRDEKYQHRLTLTELVDMRRISHADAMNLSSKYSAGHRVGGIQVVLPLCTWMGCHLPSGPRRWSVAGFRVEVAAGGMFQHLLRRADLGLWRLENDIPARVPPTGQMPG